MSRLAQLLPAVVCLVAISATTAFGQPRLAGRFGEANVGGQRVIVHVTVAVPPGFDEAAVADDALRGQGARPFQPAEFAVTGLLWDPFFNGNGGDDFVTQNYNSTGAPLVAGSSLRNSQDTWSNVTTSKFEFADGGATTRCPSLVRECGQQTFDGFNDVGWLSLSGCCTLAVTWFSTSIDEADMALNTRFPWSTNGGGGYDVETVMLHENGHVLGLDHSGDTDAIMQATYGGVQRSLGQDDERGVTYLYPEPGTLGTISGTVTAISGGGIAGASIRITNVPASTTTNGSGQFSLQGIPDLGTYTVTVSAKGYKTTTVANVGVGDNVSIVLERRGK